MPVTDTTLVTWLWTAYGVELEDLDFEGSFQVEEEATSGQVNEMVMDEARNAGLAHEELMKRWDLGFVFVRREDGN
jgi:hypothetical protein